MADRPIVDQIKHYQRDIDRDPNNVERMMRCLNKLYVLPVRLLHLQETGVGRSVNALRKYNNEVGEAAKALVTKWKKMVAKESEIQEALERETREAEEVDDSEPEMEIMDNDENEVNGVDSDHEDVKIKTDSSKSHEVKSNRHSKNHDEKSSKSKNDNTRSPDKHRSSSKNIDKKKSNYDDKKKSSHHTKSEEKSRKIEDSKSSRKQHKHEDKGKKRKIKESSESEEQSSSEDESENSEDDSSSSASSSSSSDEEVDQPPPKKRKHSDKGENLEKKQSKKTNGYHSSKHDHHSSSKSSSSKSSEKSISPSKHSSKSLDKLIKENEKIVKKEKVETSSKSKTSSPTKSSKKSKVKIEKNEDGSIDSGSGTSFEAALLGLAAPRPPKKKKKHSSPKATDNSHSKSSKVISDKTKTSESKSKINYSKPSTSSFSPVKIKTEKLDVADLMKEPELLSKPPPDHHPLLDISSTLPEISPNYRPLPRVPPRRLSNCMSEDATLTNIMTTKNQRTKVFSGAKHGVYLKVPSLYRLCLNVLYENIEVLEYTGGVPYDILKPLLERLSADQLFIIEHHNPYLVEETDELWKFHANKDFRGKNRDEMESWRDLYLRLMEERENKLRALTENISKSIAKTTSSQKVAKLAYVDSVAKPPRNVAKKQAKYGTGSSVHTSQSPSDSKDRVGAGVSQCSTHKEQKEAVVHKALTGEANPLSKPSDVVPNPVSARSSSGAIMKKKKAPLMQKALQLIKGNRRFR